MRLTNIELANLRAEFLRGLECATGEGYRELYLDEVASDLDACLCIAEDAGLEWSLDDEGEKWDAICDALWELANGVALEDARG